MKRLAIALILLLAACASPAPTQVAQVVVPTQVQTVCGTPVALHKSVISECWDQLVTETPTATLTPTPTDTATATPTDTATPTPLPSATATITNVVQLIGWHAPGAHLDPVTHHPLNPHEHGCIPYDWVLSSGHAPFTQTRESHQGYKGVCVDNDQGGKGVQAYLITHILSTAAAMSHGDHDFQLWLKTPGTGAVSYWSGLLDFGTPPVTRTVDTGERPIILSKKPGCNTWYQRPGALVFDMGWTICQSYQEITGTVLGGNGIYRGTDFQIYISRMSEFPGGDPDLAKFCTDDGFGHCRISFLSTGHDYPGADVVVPIN